MQTILGAGGAIATELAAKLKDNTSDIRLVSRKPTKVNETDHLLPADLTRKEEVYRAIEGSSVVYVCIGFPYSTKIWEKIWIPFMEHVCHACAELGTKLVFFDNVYAIGANHIHHITEKSPVSPTSRKGKVRAAVDEIIIKSIEKGRLEAIIARAPDFFGGTSRANSVLINLVYENLIKGKKAQWFCNAGRIHSMGYVPDLALGTAMLGNTPEAYNQIWNLPASPEKTTGEEWIGLFADALGTGKAYTTLPNWLVRTIGLFVPVMKELAEMNYQYEQDYYFDSSKFRQFFEYSPRTNAVAVQEAIKQLKGNQVTQGQ